MLAPFKKDPIEYNQRQLFPTSVFDLLPEDRDCFVYEIYSARLILKVLKKNTVCLASMHVIQGLLQQYLSTPTAKESLAPERSRKDAGKIF